MGLSTVSEWLVWIKKVHPSAIELGLERVSAVAQALGLLSPSCPVITVGGTNGKGSTAFGLESIYTALNYRTGTFTSPYLHHYREQIRINGLSVSDDALCGAFAQVEAARGEISLTAFEFGSLAALVLFKQQPLDVYILEVGLGGRLDAVNVLDATVAVVTSIDIDHVDWLGPTREDIGREKAGIFRPSHPAVCGDSSPPRSLMETAAHLGAPLFVQGRDFTYQEHTHDWTWECQTLRYEHLPLNTLATQNMATVIMVVALLQTQLPVPLAAIKQGLAMVSLPGRIQSVPGPIPQIWDVSHNPAAVALLRKKLEGMPHTGRTYAVFSMLADKDIEGSVLAIRDEIDVWHVAPLQTKRAASLSLLQTEFAKAGVQQVRFFTTVADAYHSVLQSAQIDDNIIVFGSFHTVAEVAQTN